MASSPSIFITVAQHCDGIWQLALPTCWPPASCSLPLPLLQSPLGNPSKRSSLPGSDWECQFFEGREREMKRHCRIVFRSRTRSPSPNQETGRQLKPFPPPCKVWSNEQKKFREYKLQTVEGWRTKVVSEAMGEEALLSGNICHHWLHSHQCDVFSSLYMYISYIFCLYPLPSDVDTNISFKLDGNWSASKPWHPQVFSAGPTEKTSFTLTRFREGLG